MKTPEQKAEEYLKFIYDESFDDPCYAPDVAQSKKDFLAGYKAANEWISVDDELPENDTQIVMKNTECYETMFYTSDDEETLKTEYLFYKPIE